MSEAIEHFEAALPEITGRVRSYSRRFHKHERDEAEAEMLALAFSRFVSKVKRTGVYLTPGQVAFMAYLGVRDGRVLATGGGVTDVHAPLAFRAGRVRRMSLSELSGPKDLPDSTIRQITAVISTKENDTPLTRAAMRIDWAALALRLDQRLRMILKGLIVGETKSSLAQRIGVSPGRLTQLLRVLAQKIRDFFGIENLPHCCAS
jgi:hypothetical protein